jgi:hypothetical protein
MYVRAAPFDHRSGTPLNRTDLACGALDFPESKDPSLEGSFDLSGRKLGYGQATEIGGDVTSAYPVSVHLAVTV